MLKILPKHVGVGFCSKEAIPTPHGYSHSQHGIWHNYLFTKADYKWPKSINNNKIYIIDGFSPNLNKQLHVGHLRNLILASSLQKILPNSQFIAWLGGSLGIQDGAIENFKKWCTLGQYNPTLYIDIEFGKEHQPKTKFEIGCGEQTGCEIWNDVIVKRSNGTPTYAYYDLLLRDWIKPDYYITGAEQREHFQSLNLTQNHLPMGLVLGDDGKKMKSRNGDAFSAEDAVEAVKANLKDTPEPDKLAWNIIVWNFLKSSREKNIQFNPAAWCNATASGGLAIAYTYARIKRALGNDVDTADQNLLTEYDVKLLGMSEYINSYLEQAINSLDPAPIANYGLDLANEMSRAYHLERISDGRNEFRFALTQTLKSLKLVMQYLSLYQLEVV